MAKIYALLKKKAADDTSLAEVWDPHLQLVNEALAKVKSKASSEQNDLEK